MSGRNHEPSFKLASGTRTLRDNIYEFTTIGR